MCVCVFVCLRVSVFPFLSVCVLHGFMVVCMHLRLFANIRHSGRSHTGVLESLRLRKPSFFHSHGRDQFKLITHEVKCELKYILNMLNFFTGI